MANRNSHTQRKKIRENERKTNITAYQCIKYQLKVNETKRVSHVRFYTVNQTRGKKIQQQQRAYGCGDEVADNQWTKDTPICVV